MFAIHGSEVHVGGVMKGRLSDLILFIGKNIESPGSDQLTRNGFALFRSCRFYKQHPIGNNLIITGGENPYLFECNTYWGTGWSWAIERLGTPNARDNIIWIGHSRFVIPYNGSMILFEGCGKIGSCKPDISGEVVDKEAQEMIKDRSVSAGQGGIVIGGSVGGSIIINGD